MVHMLIVAEDGVYGSCITADFNSISHTPANTGSNAAFQFCIVKGIYNFNRQLLCEAIHFSGPCRRRKRKQRSARNSWLDHAGRVWWDSFAKGIVVYRRKVKKFFLNITS